MVDGLVAELDMRGGDAAWVAASKPEASLISVGSLNAVPKKLKPTMGYPGARSKTRCPENEVVAINQIGSPRRIVGGGHDGIELELANRRVNSVGCPHCDQWRAPRYR